MCNQCAALDVDIIIVMGSICGWQHNERKEQNLENGREWVAEVRNWIWILLSALRSIVSGAREPRVAIERDLAMFIESEAYFMGIVASRI
jgi:hypothetical protein